MQPRIVRSPDFQTFNEDKKFEINDSYSLALNYENFNY